MSSANLYLNLVSAFWGFRVILVTLNILLHERKKKFSVVPSSINTTLFQNCIYIALSIVNKSSLMIDTFLLKEYLDVRLCECCCKLPRPQLMTIGQNEAWHIHHEHSNYQHSMLEFFNFVHRDTWVKQARFDPSDFCSMWGKRGSRLHDFENVLFIIQNYSSSRPTYPYFEQ